MRVQLKKLFTGLSISVLLISSLVVTINPQKAKAAACPDKPYMVVNPSIEVAGEYAVWIREKREAATSPQIHISTDGGNDCSSMQKSSGTNWNWVSGSGGTLKKSIDAGVADIRIYISGGSIYLATLLLTLDTSCTPEEDGSNCVVEPLEFTVTGIAQGQTISGSPVIETTINDPPEGSILVEYSFDGGDTFSSSTTSPYCLVLTGGTCAGWPSSSLSDGEHTLTVRTVSENGISERTLRFSIQNQVATAPPSAPNPSPTPSSPTSTPPASPTTSPITPSPTPTTSPVTARPNPSPAPTPAPSPASTTPTVATPTPSPTPASTQTVRQISAGQQQALQENVPTSAPSTNITTSEGVIQDISSSTSTSTPSSVSSKAYVAGLNIEKKLSGKVIITTPDDIYLNAGDKVELLVGGKVIESKPIEQNTPSTSFVLDTTQIKNGNTIVSLRITRENGEISTYSSNAEIANGTIAATVGNAQNTWLRTSLLFILFIGLAVAGFFGYRYYRQRQAYNFLHNTADYTYVQPENPYYAAAGATAAVFLAFGAVLTLGQIGGYAANVGYVVQLKNATIPTTFAVASETESGIDYVHMLDSGSAGVEDPHENHGGSNDDDNPSNQPPSDDDGTPAQPQSEAYQNNLNKILAASSRNTRFDDAERANTKSVDLYDNPELYGHPNDYNTSSDNAYNTSLFVPNTIMFRTECGFSHFSYDDPIVYPNQPGKAHLHMNFGNTHTNAYSTYSSLIDSGNGTCSGMELNRTGYWVPAMIDDRGNARIPDRVLVYYKAQSPEVIGNVKPYPDGLKLLIGTTFNESSSEGMVFMCNYNPPKSKFLVNCGNSNGLLHMVITFPRCYKQNPNVEDYQNVYVNQLGGWWWGGCPAGSDIYPFLQYNVFYRVEAGEDSSKWHLSSDVDATTRTKSVANGASAHGDWYGAWNKQINQDFLDGCLNNVEVARIRGGECGFGSLVPCIAGFGFTCTQFASGLPMRALKNIDPRLPVTKVPLNQLHSEICPQSPLPASATIYEYSYCTP